MILFNLIPTNYQIQSMKFLQITEHWKSSGHLRLEMYKTLLSRGLLLLSFPSATENAMFLPCPHTSHQSITKFGQPYLPNVAPMAPPTSPSRAAALIHASITPLHDCSYRLTMAVPASALTAAHSDQSDPPFTYRSHVVAFFLYKQYSDFSSHLSWLEVRDPHDLTWCDPITSDLIFQSTLSPFPSPATWPPCSSSSLPGILPPRNSSLGVPSSWKSVTWRYAWAFPHLLLIFTPMSHPSWAHSSPTCMKWHSSHTPDSHSLV